MKRQDIVISLGLLILQANASLTAENVRAILRREFGRKSIKTIEAQIQEHGGYKEYADELALKG